jgi:hypothetical protein
VSREVSFAAPVGAPGASALTGGAATGAVAAEAALALPSTLLAVTLTRTVRPTSAAPSVYAEPVAPGMSEPSRCQA